MNKPIKTAVVRRNGEKVPPNHGITQDSVETTFQITIHSLGRVDEDVIKRLIQERYKVKNIEIKGQRIIAM
jgi:hypothetical protein